MRSAMTVLLGITGSRVVQLSSPKKEVRGLQLMCSTSLKLLADRRPTNCARSIFSLRRNIFCL